MRNDLAEGRYRVEGKPVVLSDIRLPIFAVGTLRDHVAPWSSVFKINLLTDTSVTFVLTSGGHNAGVVSEPGHEGRTFQIGARHQDGLYVDPQTWKATAARHNGSWWPAWQTWLARRSGEREAPPPIGARGEGHGSLGEAPGTYVFIR